MRALKHLCVVVQCVNPLVTTQAREGIETALAAAADALAAAADALAAVTTQAHEGIETDQMLISPRLPWVTTQAHEGIETGGVQYISAFSVNAQ